MAHEGQETFGQFGTSFQEKILQALLTDKRWAQQVEEVIDIKYFDLEYMSYLAEKYFNHFKRYKDFPTLQLLITIVREDFRSINNKNTVLRDQVVRYLTKIKHNPDVSDLPYVKDKALDFCRRQAMKLALYESAELINSEKYDTVVERMKRAIAAGMPLSVGHELLVDGEKRWAITNRSPIPTGLEQLDQKRILNGGLGMGELGVIIAPTGIGKSHFLTMLGANALQAKKNVLHYTFELSENITGLRYDSNICDIDSTDIPSQKKKVTQRYKELAPSLGRLFIKEYPANRASVNTLRAHVEKLQLSKNFIPDIIIIDYADIMRSTERYDSLRHELKLVYEELRGWASEIQLPIWTASQSNREGASADIIDTTNMSEAYGKAMVSDVVLSLSRKLVDKQQGLARLYVAKNRAGQDGFVWTVEIDTARSKFEVVSEYNSIDDAKTEQQKELDRVMKQEWREFRKDSELVLLDPKRPNEGRSNSDKVITLSEAISQ